MVILGIETSCDETAAAVVTQDKKILSNVLYSQIREHKAFAGVVPEVAARSHLESLNSLISVAMTDAKLTFEELDGIAVTCGPGLIGGVMVGVMAAKTLAAYHDLPFLAVNHLAAHALTARLTHSIDFPYLVLLVSGGHTQLLIAHSALQFELLGSTLDDAVGEAFDKTARLLGLPYPGGPEIEKLAQDAPQEAIRSAHTNKPSRYVLPRPLLTNKDPALRCSFSLSGLKTAVRRHIEAGSLSSSEMKPLQSGDPLPLNHQDKAELAAAFQTSISDILSSRLANALVLCHERNLPLQGAVLAGGVAANLAIRARLTSITDQHSTILVAPPVKLCTDNAAMVAWAGVEKMTLGARDSLDFIPRPRWPLKDL